MIVKALLFAATLVFSQGAHAFPNSIGMGYTSCLNCHYHPAGNGILTDYGRSIGVNYYSAKPFWDKKADEEKVAKYGEFFPGWNNLTDHIRPELNYRGLEYWSGINAPHPTAPNYIAMEADASLVVRADDENHLFVAGSIGRVPGPNQPNSNSWVTRSHYLGYRPSDAWGFYLGLQDVTFGIKLPDHILFSREATGIAENDQSHSLLIHYLQENYELFLQAFVGNLIQQADLRQKGGSAMIEVGPSKDVRYGASFLMSQNNYRKRTLASVHERYRVSEGNALLGEVGAIKYNPVGGSTVESTLGFYGMLQPSFRITRGFYSLWTAEFYSEDWFKSTARILRISPGLEWFFMPKVELRGDLQLTRILGTPIQQADPLTLLLQVNAWL